IKQDPLVDTADVEIVNPGESARIVTIRDIIEPRAKVEGGGIAYPGILGRPIDTVGSGRTNRLGGIGIITCSLRMDSRRYGLLSSVRPGTAYGNFLEMSGPGAISPNAAMSNVCLLLQPNGDLDPDSANRVAQNAMLAINDRLAAATVGRQPTEIEVFDLTPEPGLPNIVYMHSIVSPEATTLNPDSTLGTAVYGVTRLTQPWFLHPTEVLDGAACGNFGGWLTWPLTNTIVLDMCRKHGKEFNFLACIMVRTMWEEQRMKELMANRAALLATTLGADGAIITPTLRGQRFLDTIAVVQACERAGIKTVLITEEEDDEDGTAPPLLVSSQEVVAVVSTGDGSAPGPFPPVERVVGAGEIGREWYGEQEPPHGRYGTSHLNDVFGFSTLSCVDY
ncbi:MAG: glycine/sarcosine/betaine reductase component B subunit, partial [Ardenticatenaceae bacterium]